MRGKVCSTIGGVYNVYLDNKTFIKVTPLGILKHQKVKIIVGDEVEVNVEEKTLTKVFERKNMLIRPRISNIDLGIIVMSLKTPSYSSYLIDKFLTLLNVSNITPLVILTKEDLIEDKTIIERIKKQYALLNVKIIDFSKRTLKGLDLIKEEIKGKTIAFMGQTGVGKSSLINIINENFNREIGEYSLALGRGKHQTKEVILLPFEEGFIGDTPGFSSLELNMFKEDLAAYFPLINSVYTECRYSNCLHQNEPECKVKELLDKELLDKENYDNYLQMLGELSLRKDRY